MTDLARAFALQSTGGVLLVDGDLRYGRLSHSMCPPGPGMVEVMLGMAHWGEVIHRHELAAGRFCGRRQQPGADVRSAGIRLGCDTAPIPRGADRRGHGRRAGDRLAGGPLRRRLLRPLAPRHQAADRQLRASTPCGPRAPTCWAASSSTIDVDRPADFVTARSAATSFSSPRSRRLGCARSLSSPRLN